METKYRNQIILHPHSKKIQKLVSSKKFGKNALSKTSNVINTKQNSKLIINKEQMIITQIKEFLSHYLPAQYTPRNIITELEKMDDETFYKLLLKTQFPSGPIESFEKLNQVRTKFIDWIKSINDKYQTRNRSLVVSPKENANFKRRLLESSAFINSDESDLKAYHLLKQMHSIAQANLKNKSFFLKAENSNLAQDEEYRIFPKDTASFKIIIQRIKPLETEPASVIQASNSINQLDKQQDEALDSNYFQGMELGETHEIFSRNFMSMGFDWTKDNAF